MIIDVHAHHFPPTYLQFLHEAGIGGVSAPRRDAPVFAPTLAPPALKLAAEDLAGRFSAMDSAGVERQVLSAAIAPYSTDEAQAVRGATLINDAYAELVAAHSDRLSFWASLPLPHVAQSLAEIARSFDSLGAVGVTLQCFCLNETIARDDFEPIFAELDRREAVVFLHPCQNGVCSHLVSEWGLTVCAGASMEDSLVAMHLITKQIPARYPRVRFIVPHFGGILPMLLERLDGQMPQDGFAEPPSATARRFFYDTVGWGSAPALLAAHTAFGASQLVPGSDWPILLGWESYAQTFEHIRTAKLPQEDINQILNNNVQTLLASKLPDAT